MPYGKPKNTFTTRDGCRLIMRANRYAMGLSIRELAKRTNYSPSYIGEIEAGTCDVSINTAKSIAKALMNPKYWEIAEKFKFKEVSPSGDMIFKGSDGTELVVKRDDIMQIFDEKQLV